MNGLFRIMVLLLSASWLASCASTVPLSIREPARGDPGVAAAAADINAYSGQEVRWGGSIIAAENRASDTWLTVLARPLDSDGQPETDDQGFGRFIAVVGGFLDPAVYAQGRLITVRGHITGSKQRNVGAYPYRYPVVKVDSYHLWPPLKERTYRDYPPYWYSPWYDPWYPFYGPRWPYYPY